MARRHAVRLGIPALIVAGLALYAFSRVSQPEIAPETAATSGVKASLENVEVRQVTSSRTFWMGDIDEPPAFAVLDPDVKRTGLTAVTPGARVSVVGLVRPAPEPEVAMRQWQIDAATAHALQERGTYVHVTEILAVQH